VVVVFPTHTPGKPPAGGAGPADVVVTVGAAHATLTNGFLYLNPAPTATAINPTSGPVAGGTDVTITGTNFFSGATVLIGGSAATNVAVVSPTQITAKTPLGAAGPSDVVVTNTDFQSATIHNGFTYFLPAPTLGSVTPAAGPVTGGTFITLDGTNFQSGATVKVGGAAATPVTFVNANRLTALTPAGSLGAKDVVVTNPDTQFVTKTGAFTYQAVVSPPPTLTTLAPVSGPAAGGTSVTINGTNFQTGAMVRFGADPAASLTVVSATKIIAISPAHDAGPVDVFVINPDAQSAVKTNGFRFMAAPSLLGISPDHGTAAGGTELTLFGENFVSGATIKIGGVAATGVTFVDANSIQALSPAGTPGPADVVVRNPDGQISTLTEGYVFDNDIPLSQPVIDSISPNQGPLSGGTPVTIRGSLFATGLQLLFGDAPATAVAVSASEITAVTPAGAVGPVDVTVINPDGGGFLFSKGFTYSAAPAGAGAPGIKAFPNPFHGSKNQKVTVLAPTGSTVSIFAVNGQRVRDLDETSPGEFEWDIRNQSGERVVAGNYLYDVKSPGGEKKVGQLVVIP
jgi:hypothetical protein